jgi:hypothetical protein
MGVSGFRLNGKREYGRRDGVVLVEVVREKTGWLRCVCVCRCGGGD